MAVVKIEEVILYITQETSTMVENLEALSFLDHSGIPYTKLIYADSTQYQAILDALNSWWARPDIALPPATGFPLLIYTEVHDDIPARYSPVKYKQGLEAIKTFPEFYFSIMKPA